MLTFQIPHTRLLIVLYAPEILHLILLDTLSLHIETILYKA